MAKTTTTSKMKAEVQARLQATLTKAGFTPDALAEFELSNQDFTEDDLENDYWRTGLIPFDLITAGRGIPKGRLINVWSGNGIGKTTLFYSAVKSAILFSHIKVMWLAVEPTKKLAYDMGLIGEKAVVPRGSFKFLEASTYSDLEKITNSFLTSDFDVLVVDSLTAVMQSPEKLVDRSIEDRQVAEDARLAGAWLKNTHGYTYKIPKSIMYITQERNKIATHAWEKGGPVTQGGNASLHYSDIRFTVKGQAKINGKDSGTVTSSQAGTKGFLITEKGRHAPPGVKIPVIIIFGKGASNRMALFDFLSWKGDVKSGGAGWYTIKIGPDEFKVQGKSEALKTIGERQEILLEMFYPLAKDYFNYLREESAFKGD